MQNLVDRSVDANEVEQARQAIFAAAWSSLNARAHELGPLMTRVKRELDSHVAAKAQEVRKTRLHATLLQDVAGRGKTSRQFDAVADGLERDLAEVLRKQRRLVARRRWMMIREHLLESRRLRKIEEGRALREHHATRRQQLVEFLGISGSTDVATLDSFFKTMSAKRKAATKRMKEYVPNPDYAALRSKLISGEQQLSAATKKNGFAKQLEELLSKTLLEWQAILDTVKARFTRVVLP